MIASAGAILDNAKMQIQVPYQHLVLLFSAQQEVHQPVNHLSAINCVKIEQDKAWQMNADWVLVQMNLSCLAVYEEQMWVALQGVSFLYHKNRDLNTYQDTQ